MHGANRLGGNGVANSTVFGGIAGDTMAQWAGRHGAFQDPNAAELAAAVERAEAPFNGPATAASAGAIEQIRETLFTTMWDDAGIVRDAEGLARAADVLDDLSEELAAYRLPDNARDRSFNLTWHDALNLANLVNVSQVIVRAAQARENSRGAHYRADFEAPGDLASSTFTSVRRNPGGAIAVAQKPVHFSRRFPSRIRKLPVACVARRLA